mmetsp:Transcript_21435/g.48552  ORF Transcript_21435/g.48552 Transcript_21435/m.48552 type:complete len:206 (+) Transcript_21435:2137-2754(+)
MVCPPATHTRPPAAAQPVNFLLTKRGGPATHRGGEEGGEEEERESVAERRRRRKAEETGGTAELNLGSRHPPTSTTRLSPLPPFRFTCSFRFSVFPFSFPFPPFPAAPFPCDTFSLLISAFSPALLFSCAAAIASSTSLSMFLAPTSVDNLQNARPMVSSDTCGKRIGISALLSVSAAVRSCGATSAHRRTASKTASSLRTLSLS